MDPRNKSLITAAQTVFAKYGVGKTTMNDIAREAGVARQTLYNAYPSKEAVLRATVRYFSDQTLEVVDNEWANQATLFEKLNTYFKLGPLNWYDAVTSSPESADLIDGIHTIASDELDDIAKLWNARFEKLVREHAKPGSAASKDPAATADFIYSASLNAKTNAADRTVLEARLTILSRAIVALLDADGD